LKHEDLYTQNFQFLTGLDGNSDDITSNQNTAVSPTGGTGELVQQMEKTILLWCSCLHPGHTVLGTPRRCYTDWEHVGRNGRKTQTRRWARMFEWPKAENFKSPNTKIWNVLDL